MIPYPMRKVNRIFTKLKFTTKGGLNVPTTEYFQNLDNL